MGNSNGKKMGSLPNLQRRFTGKSHHHHLTDSKGFVRYNDKELTLLDRMFQDLAKRSPDETMSKETFLQYFALPGILGERLFAVFDAKKNGVIDFEEFVNGLARYNRGSLQEKIAMLFEMYDMDGQSQVKPEELSLILYSVITPTTSLFYSNNNYNTNSTDNATTNGHNNKEQSNKPNTIGTNNNNKSGITRHVSKLTRQTVEKMVNDAFEHCDTNKDGLLSQDQFASWVKQNPGALQLLETVFAKHIWSGWDDRMDPALIAENINNGSFNSQDADLAAIEDNNNNNDESKETANSPKEAAYSPRNAPGFKNRSSKELRNSSYMSLTALALPNTFPLNHRCQSNDELHFRTLYDKLTQIYLDEGDEHRVFVCAHCEYKYYTSIHIEEPLDEENRSLNDYNQFVIFNKKNNASIDIKYCPECGSKVDKYATSSVSEIMNLGTAATLLPSTSTATLNEVGRKGTLYKIGAKFKSFISRYYVIREKFLYTFKKEASDAFPINVVFIAGWYIAEINDNYTDKGYYGIQMTAPSVKQSKILYSKSRSDRDEWVRCLQIAAATQSIKQHYSIGRTLGKGHFSLVHLGIHRETGKECAIKIVEKSSIDAREKMSLRNEIVMMRLVNHPCIIRMLDVFEDQQRIYMVMTLAPYGDFFARWKKRKIFDEETARVIIWKLLDATQYLHALGIVHRDLKPENILCLDENDDTMIVISDFGLSKFAAPHTEMTMPCGTLAYVAPEVLSMKGYGRKVDLWSLGCIMHLLLRGVLPFDGHTKDEVVEKTLNKKLVLTHPKWHKVSTNAKDLITKLLIKDPNNRISLADALNHEWFDVIKNDKRLAHQKDISPTIHAVMSGADDTPLPTPVNHLTNFDAQNQNDFEQL